MKAIVVRQPWATLIALGVKKIETRPAPPSGEMRPEGVRGLPGCSLVRGERIAIVAGAQRPKEPTVVGDYHVYNDNTSRSWLLDADETWSRPLPLGAVVCTVVVDDALPIVPCEPYDHPITRRDGNCAARADWLREWGGPRLRLGYIGTGGLDGGPWLVFGLGDSADASPMRDQLPLGDYEPGRWGWLLSDPQPPRAWCPGSGRRMAAHNSTPRYSCAVCGQRYLALAPGDATAPDHRVPCDPIPCKGRQGVFELPADVAEALSRGEAS